LIASARSRRGAAESVQSGARSADSRRIVALDMALMLDQGSAPSLRERRTLAGLSQQTLAEKAACSLSMVRLLEQGLEPMRSDVLPRIEAILAQHNENDGAEATAPSSETSPAGQGQHEKS
jgi:ribosome-binding protein aMBF1 (putative translation factor)